MDSIQVGDKKFIPCISAEQIESTLVKLAQRINKDLKDKNPLFIVVLNGAFMFASDLLKKITIECEVSFVKLSSYQGMHSSGKVKEVMGLDRDIDDRTVVVIEDIVDTGNTIEQILWDLQERAPREILVATLLFKPDIFSKTFVIDYVGFMAGPEFLVGYGLDYNGNGRNLPHLYKNVTK